MAESASMNPQFEETIALLPAAEGRCCDLPPSLRWSPQEAQRLAEMFKALGHPVRLQIVDLLARFDRQVCVCDVEAQFDLTQPTISHHLRILREAGLVDCEKRGLWVYYYAKPDALAQVGALAAQMAAS